MPNFVLNALSKKALVASFVAAGLSMSAVAQDIPLVNPSFELPDIPTPTPGSTNQADYVLPFIEGWEETGPITNQQGFDGKLDTGVFINTPVDFGGGVIIPPIPNADGGQLAFMQVNPDAGQNGNEMVSIWQETPTLYESGKSYTFTIGVGHGVVFPPTSEPGNPATIVLSLGFLGPTTGDFIDIQNFVLEADDLYPTDIPNSPPILIDLSVTADENAVNSPSADGAALGNEIVVRVMQMGGTGGGFNLDKARLSAVPEPSSLALLGLAGAAFLRRRR